MSTHNRPAPVHPRHQLNNVLMHPVRFSIMAALAHTETDFRTLRDHLQVSDSVLSKQATALEAALLIKIRKGYIGKRPRTWLRTTPEGDSAWTSHLAALREIAGADALPPGL
ncbi:winged helix-turn-helix domain-containing protein [Arthrobacter roseus]|uniref:winged helix-turn-helix domain-containing protein n=1 Tax=Arthrobacter roseus TaxID=136274 RepID=UPI0019632689|nr:transcriptional regulator [Arthrobacter roseus]MBM7847911.1 DNA-binding MarR family transcriptional regulator [Arthrobacter roseus]